jgi:hypothetical protein
LEAVDIPWHLIVKEFHKDMIMLGWNIPIESFEEGPIALQKIIFQLLESQPKAVREFLYRLSVPESALSEIMHQRNEELSKTLVEIICTRCKQRIQLRKYFS